MPRGRVTKVDILARVYKLKNKLNKKHANKPGLWLDGADQSLNDVLDILNEYSQ